MGKKKERNVGCVLIADHRKTHKRRDPKKDSWLHTTEMDELPYPGYDAKLDKLKSCTEQSNLMEFLSTAELAGQDFTSERNAALQVIDPKTSGILNRDILETRRKAQEEKKSFLRIPRRPPWDSTTTAEELELSERSTFVEWRRDLAALQEDENLICTPFEKNLELWRQLWRVVERSDVLVQIVDARNPLLFYCPDLEAYAREVDPSKKCAILMNKSDLLTEEQRRFWANYFQQRGMKVVFWSALAESEKIKNGEEDVIAEEAEEEEDDDVDDEYGESEADSIDDDHDGDFDEDYDGDSDDDDDEWETESEEEISALSTEASKELDSPASSKPESKKKTRQISCSSSSSVDFVVEDGLAGRVAGLELNSDDPALANSRNSPSKKPRRRRALLWDWDSGGELVNAHRLLRFFASSCRGKDTKMEGVTTIGLVGYPNVGKSSTINAILKSKKVAVSATPGKTKHFQTIYVDPSLMLCDCPGLVFPSFVTSKEELILNGILPVDQLRDYTPPVNLLCDRVARWQLESVYGIRIPLPPEGEEGRPPNAEEFLSSYGLMRGYMTSQGRPDCARSARVVLKDHVNGKLLYCHAPPGVDANDFRRTENDDGEVRRFLAAAAAHDSDDDDEELSVTTQASSLSPEQQRNHNKKKNNNNKRTATSSTTETDRLDREFFAEERPGFGTRGKKAGGEGTAAAGEGKSWKKHNNRNKKEKLRRVYGYLDQ